MERARSTNAQGERVREYTVSKGAKEGGELNEREEVGLTFVAEKERGRRGAASLAIGTSLLHHCALLFL